MKSKSTKSALALALILAQAGPSLAFAQSNPYYGGPRFKSERDPSSAAAQFGNPDSIRFTSGLFSKTESPKPEDEKLDDSEEKPSVIVVAPTGALTPQQTVGVTDDSKKDEDALAEKDTTPAAVKATAAEKVAEAKTFLARIKARAEKLSKDADEGSAKAAEAESFRLQVRQMLGKVAMAVTDDDLSEAKNFGDGIVKNLEKLGPEMGKSALLRIAADAKKAAGMLKLLGNDPSAVAMAEQLLKHADDVEKMAASASQLPTQTDVENARKNLEEIADLEKLLNAQPLCEDVSASSDRDEKIAEIKALIGDKSADDLKSEALELWAKRRELLDAKPAGKDAESEGTLRQLYRRSLKRVFDLNPAERSLVVDADGNPFQRMNRSANLDADMTKMESFEEWLKPAEKEGSRKRELTDTGKNRLWFILTGRDEKDASKIPLKKVDFEHLAELQRHMRQLAASGEDKRSFFEVNSAFYAKVDAFSKYDNLKAELAEYQGERSEDAACVARVEVTHRNLKELADKVDSMSAGELSIGISGFHGAMEHQLQSSGGSATK